MFCTHLDQNMEEIKLGGTVCYMCCNPGKREGRLMWTDRHKKTLCG